MQQSKANSSLTKLPFISSEYLWLATTGRCNCLSCLASGQRAGNGMHWTSLTASACCNALCEWRPIRQLHRWCAMMNKTVERERKSESLVVMGKHSIYLDTRQQPLYKKRRRRGVKTHDWTLMSFTQCRTCNAGISSETECHRVWWVTQSDE